MGHLISPLVFRLWKSQFWVSSWTTYNKKNYKKSFLEDLNCFAIFKWLTSLVNFKNFCFQILDVNFIKFYKLYVFNLIIFILHEDFTYSSTRDEDIIFTNIEVDRSVRKFSIKAVWRLMSWVYRRMFSGKWAFSASGVRPNNKLYNIWLNTRTKRQKSNQGIIKLFFDSSNVHLANYNYYKNFFLLKKKLKIFITFVYGLKKKQKLKKKILCSWKKIEYLGQYQQWCQLYRWKNSAFLINMRNTFENWKILKNVINIAKKRRFILHRWKLFQLKLLFGYKRKRSLRFKWFVQLKAKSNLLIWVFERRNRYHRVNLVRNFSPIKSTRINWFSLININWVRTQLNNGRMTYRVWLNRKKLYRKPKWILKVLNGNSVKKKLGIIIRSHKSFIFEQSTKERTGLQNRSIDLPISRYQMNKLKVRKSVQFNWAIKKWENSIGRNFKKSFGSFLRFPMKISSSVNFFSKKQLNLFIQHFGDGSLINKLQKSSAMFRKNKIINFKNYLQQRYNTGSSSLWFLKRRIPFHLYKFLLPFQKKLVSFNWFQQKFNNSYLKWFYINKRFKVKKFTELKFFKARGKKIENRSSSYLQIYRLNRGAYRQYLFSCAKLHKTPWDLQIIKFRHSLTFFSRWLIKRQFQQNCGMLSFCNYSSSNLIYPFGKILQILKKFIEFFLLKNLKIQKILVNFFKKNSYMLSSKYLKWFIQFEIYNRGFRISHIMNILKNSLRKNSSIWGFRLGYFGRYQKRLRNKDRSVKLGPLSLSNIISLISYDNFVILLKQGITGIEIKMLKKMKKNEIF